MSDSTAGPERPAGHFAAPRPTGPGPRLTAPQDPGAPEARTAPGAPEPPERYAEPAAEHEIPPKHDLPQQEPPQDALPQDDPAAPAPLGIERTPTGHAEVDAQLERLADADHLGTDGHLTVYEDVHRGLRDALTALDSRPGPPVPAPRPGGPDPRS